MDNELKGPRKVTTTIPFKWWMLGNIKGVNWNEALVLGLKMITNTNEDEEVLQKEIELLEGELFAKKQLLTDRLERNKKEVVEVEGTPLPEHFEFGGI